MADIRKIHLSEDGSLYDIMPGRVDSTPTASSTNMVTSGGIKTYVDSVGANAKADWFLRGPMIERNTDFNTLTTPGHYYVDSNDSASTMTNIPIAYGGRLEITAIISDTSYLRQTYYANSDSAGLVCIRRSKTSEPGWSEWVILPTQDDVLSAVYGSGIIIPDGADLNNDAYKIPGIYYRKSASTSSYIGNIPVTSNYFKIIVELVYPDQRLRQTFVSLTRDCTYYMRVYDSSGWQAWNKFRSFDQTIYNIYGIGTSITTGTDLDDLTTPGLYTCSTTTIANSCSNKPVTDAAFRLEVKCLNNANRIRQEFYPVSGASEFYVRTFDASNTWKPWYKFSGTQIQVPSDQTTNLSNEMRSVVETNENEYNEALE